MVYSYNYAANVYGTKKRSNMASRESPKFMEVHASENRGTKWKKSSNLDHF